MSAMFSYVSYQLKKRLLSFHKMHVEFLSRCVWLGLPSEDKASLSYFEITNRYKGVVHIVQEQCLNTVEHYLNWMLGS